MRPYCFAFALVVVPLAGNCALGQLILTMDFVQSRRSIQDQKVRREKVASISVSVMPGHKFFAKASVDGGAFRGAAKAKAGGETVKLDGIVKSTKDGHFKVTVNPRWSKRTTANIITAAEVQFEETFERKHTLTAKSNLAAQDESAIDRARIHLENEDVNKEPDGLSYRWLGDTLVVSGLTRTSRDKSEAIRTYFYLRLKDASN